jgi:integrase
MKNNKFPIEVKKGGSIVKIYRTVDRGRDRFTVIYHEGGRRTLRQFADLSEARKEAKTAADSLNAGQGSALELTGKDREAHLYAKRKLKPLDIELTNAIDEYTAAKKWDVPLSVAAKFYHDSYNAKLPDKTVAEVYEEMLEYKRNRGVSKVYLIDLKTRLGHFSREFKVNIASVQTDDIDAWLRTLKLSPRSRNNHRNAVISLFNFAKKARYLNRDLTTAADHTEADIVKRKAIGIFSPAEFAKLLAAADIDILPFFVLGGFCGLRTVEITRLRWEDIRWSESQIIISEETSKGGEARRRRVPPLTTAAAEWLAGYKTRTGRVLALDKHHLRVADICKAAGVVWLDNGLRHSAITYMLATSKDAIKTAFQVGNTPQVIRSNYDAVATEQEGKLWFSILPETAPQRHKI